MRWPVRGKVISGFGPKANGLKNEGINIAVPEGTSIRAADSGVVAYAGNELKGYGNLVLIRHENGYVTAYAHAKELFVKRGDTVKRGDVIAKAGQTGSVSSPQLHFEVRKGAVALDPMKFLSSTTASQLICTPKSADCRARSVQAPGLLLLRADAACSLRSTRSMAMITVWGRRNSVNVQKVLWALEELDVPYTRENVGGSFGGNRDADFLRHEPDGPRAGDPRWRCHHVRVQRHRALSRGALPRRACCGPRSTEPRHGRAVDGMAAAEFRARRSSTLFVNLVRSLPENRNAAAVAAAEKQAADALKIADAWLARHDWFAGSDFSFGDIVMGALLWRYMGLDCAKPDMPHLLEWLEALQAREAFRRAVMAVPRAKDLADWNGSRRRRRRPRRHPASRVRCGRPRLDPGCRMGSDSLQPLPQPPRHVLDVLPGHAAGAAAARRLPVDGAGAQLLRRRPSGR